MRESRLPESKIIFLILGALVAFLLIRAPGFNVILPRVLLIGALALAIFLVYRGGAILRSRWREQAFLKSTEGRIKVRIDECRNLLARNQAEMEDIRDNIKDLQDKTAATLDIMPHHQRESRELLGAFQSELNLRQAKSAFYQSCIRKLEGLLHNHLLAQEIEAKKQRLRELQENNYEELARLEEIKSDLEMDTYYLDTIENLSQKMLRSTTFDDAEHLRLELETMTRELDEM